MSGTCAGPGSLQFEGSLARGACASPPSDFVEFPAPLQPVAQVSVVSTAGEWSQPPDASLRAPVQVQAESTWVQPYAPRLEPAAVNTEVRVVNSAPQHEPVGVNTEVRVVNSAPQYEPVGVNTEVRVVNSGAPPPCSSCQAPIAPAVGNFVPALFNAMFQFGAAPAPAPVHAAQPVPSRPR